VNKKTSFNCAMADFVVKCDTFDERRFVIEPQGISGYIEVSKEELVNFMKRKMSKGIEAYVEVVLYTTGNYVFINFHEGEI
jgi:hypothetical protein